MGAPFNFLPPGATDLVMPLGRGGFLACSDFPVRSIAEVCNVQRGNGMHGPVE